MILLINTKNKLNVNEIIHLINLTKNTDIKFCVPYKYHLNNIYLQNFEINEDIYGDNVLGSLINHSDVTDDLDMVVAKINILSSLDKISILCLGEDFINVDAFAKLIPQIEYIFDNIDSFNNIVVAYEPHWAIGGNKVCDINYIYKNALFIKNYVFKKYGFDIEILYGGSVNINLIKKLNRLKFFDGYLISSYGIKPKNLKKIIRFIDKKV